MRKLSKKPCFVIIILTCCILLMICSVWIVVAVKPIFATPTLAPRREWVNKWLYQPTCRPPCWENITPGVTSIDDVTKLLAYVPGMRVTRPPTHYSFGADEFEMEWRLAGDAADSGLARAPDDQSRLVSFIILTIGTDQSLLLEDVILSYGAPSDVQIAECRPEIGTDHCVVFAIYRQSGMAVDLFLPGNQDDTGNWKTNLLPNSEVTTIYFFPQKVNNLERILGTKFAFSPPILWKGYVEYP